ncbi:hypothetical protein BH11PSE4_BH11PSE4_22520 [soil metagenome]
MHSRCRISSIYFAVGIGNSGPFAEPSGLRRIFDFCRVSNRTLSSP